jgi:hypothetical protein
MDFSAPTESLKPLGCSLRPNASFSEGFRFAHRYTRQARYYEARHWCFAQYGDIWHAQDNHDGAWTERGGDFWFRKPQDAFAFKLRWG